MVGNQLFTGCAGKNLMIYEVDRSRVKKIKELKSTEVVYSFLQYDENTLICGEREGNIDILNLSNLDEVLLTY